MTMSDNDAEKGGFISKVIGPKRRWRAYKARVRQLPENYRTAVHAVERYLMYFVPADGDSAASMFEDLADLFEQAAADGTPIREIVGDDPVEFVEAFAQNYSKGGYVTTRERERLISAIDHAAGEDAGKENGTVR
jgi:DNA-binding ferritin-like protein (Dps family)